MFQSLICEKPATNTQNDYKTFCVSFVNSVQEVCKNQLAQHNVMQRLQSLSKPRIAVGTFVSLILFLKFGGRILTNVISWAYPGKEKFFLTFMIVQ